MVASQCRKNRILLVITVVLETLRRKWPTKMEWFCCVASDRQLCAASDPETYVCIYIYITWICDMYIYIYVWIYIYEWKKDIYIYTYEYIHINIYIYIYIHIYIYRYTSHPVNPHGWLAHFFGSGRRWSRGSIFAGGPEHSGRRKIWEKKVRIYLYMWYVIWLLYNIYIYHIYNCIICIWVNYIYDWLVVTGTWLLFSHSVGNNYSNWLIFFRGGETTNQIYVSG